MEERTITEKRLCAFRRYLAEEEKSEITIAKYLQDIRQFWKWNKEQPVTKEVVIRYKEALVSQGYAVRSINSKLASLNSLLTFCGWTDCKVKNLRMQRQIFCPQERELTREEYRRLLQVAEKQPRLHLLLQTICGTGIRVSELQYFTVEAVSRGQVTVQCKNKIRTIFVPRKLKQKLLRYAGEQRITSGPIFVTRSGQPLHRSNIWAQMKKLCGAAKVEQSKVFPHNLRKLFAKIYYSAEKDIAKLSDILGHSSINTTRIYIMSTGDEHQRQIERLGLVI
jgi:site-specific recombinase XerD